MIDFKSAFERYKNQEATEDEIKYIESELEKNQIISDYIDSQIDLDIDLSTSVNDVNMTYNTGNIKRFVNQKLATIVCISVFIVFALMGVSKYIVSPIVSSLYYNPLSKSSDTDYMSDMSLDLIANSELTMPYVDMRYVNIVDKGFGKYEGTAAFRNSFDNSDKEMDFRINKDHLQADLIYFFDNRNNSKLLSNLEQVDEDYVNSYFDDIKTELKSLPQTSYINASTVTGDLVSIDSLVKLKRIYNNIEFYWVAVATDNEISFIDENRTALFDIGFNPSYPSISYGESPSKDKYPLFFLMDHMGVNENWRMSYEDALSTHFKSLLKYSIDREEYFKLVHGRNDFERYKKALDYVEENGVYAYNLYIKGRADDILEFIETEGIVYCDILDVNTSIYSK